MCNQLQNFSSIVDGPFGQELINKIPFPFASADYKITDCYPVIDYRNKKLQIIGYLPKTNSLKRNLSKEGDILMIKLGLEIGETVIFEKLSIKEAVISNKLIKISVDNALVSTDVIYFYLKKLKNTGYFKNKIERGKTIQLISLKEVREIPLEINLFKKDNLTSDNLQTELNYQKQIRNYLTLIEKKIDVMNSSIQKQVKLLSYLKNELLSGRIRVSMSTNDLSYNPLISTSGIMQIPDDWKTINSKTDLKFQRGKVIKKEDMSETGVRVLRIKDLNGSNNEKVYTNSEINKKYYKKQDDLLVSFTGYNTNKPFMGSIGAITKDGEGFFTNELYSMKSNNEKSLLNKYLYYIFQTYNVQSQIIRYVKGLTIGHANDAINHLSFKIPSNIDEQRKIVSILENQEKIIEKYIELKEKNLRLFKELNGNIRI